MQVRDMTSAKRQFLRRQPTKQAAAAWVQLCCHMLLDWKVELLMRMGDSAQMLQYAASAASSVLVRSLLSPVCGCLSRCSHSVHVSGH